jgi:hypothetical protein
MSINFNLNLDTYVAQDAFGLVVAIYDRNKHGSLAEFRNAVAALA